MSSNRLTKKQVKQLIEIYGGTEKQWQNRIAKNNPSRKDFRRWYGWIGTCIYDTLMSKEGNHEQT
jgi:hypothetical protein